MPVYPTVYPGQSAQFQVCKIGDENNALIDYTTYYKTSRIARKNAQANLTAAAAGGGPVTATFRRSTEEADLQVDINWDPVPWDNLSRIAGGNGGVTVQLWHGKNTAPAYGDMMWQGTYTLFEVKLPAKRKQDMLLSLMFKVTDGAAIRPDWYPV